MHKVILLFLIIPLFSFSQEQKILLHRYNFPVTDGEVKTIMQSNDTLYVLQCYLNRPCQPEPDSHYKILSFQRTSDLIILKLEALDTIPLTTYPYPDTRFSTLAIKNPDNNILGYLPLQMGLTKQQLDTVQTDFQSLKSKFFFTYFSDNYLKVLSSLKSLKTKKEVLEIIELVKSEKFKQIVDRYENTETRDMYASGLSAELLNLACIEKGYNPIGAGVVLNALMKE